MQNAGATANVRNLTVTVSGLADVCDAGDDRLRGILFKGASGSITNNRALNINQGMSGCQEGNGIEARNFEDNPTTIKVVISNNTVDKYQKTGILANGDVNATVTENTITGFGPVNFIAQNGIQLGFGATGRVQDNTVSGNVYTPQTFASSGIFLFEVGSGASVRENIVGDSDVGIWLLGATSALVRSNRVTGSTFDGIALDDSFGAVSGATVDKNTVLNNGTGIGLYGAGVTNNTILSNNANTNGNGLVIDVGASGNTLSRNSARNNTDDGIFVDGSGNTITRNSALGNGNLDIENMGANTYSNNKCKTSSGPPVDCGTTPAPLNALRAAAQSGASSSARVAAPFGQ